MQSLALNLINYFPSFIVALWGLFTGPKSFISNQFKTNNAINEASYFLLFSYLVSSVFPIDQFGFKEIIRSFAGMALEITIVAWIIFKTIKMVGGEIELSDVITILFYYYGTLLIASTILFLIVFTIIECFPNSFFDYYTFFFISAFEYLNLPSQWLASLEEDAFITVLIISFISVFYSLLVVIIYFAFWGAYRERAYISKKKSFLAFILAGFFIEIFLVIYLAIILALQEWV